MGPIEMLREMREYGGKPRTTGLDDATIERFLPTMRTWPAPSRTRWPATASCARSSTHFLKLDEAEQLQRAQAGFINFYPDDAVNPYVPAAARGPWIVTLKGAVLHDNGGYGMLGFGHNNAGRARGHVQAAGDGQRDDPVHRADAPGRRAEPGTRPRPRRRQPVRAATCA